MKKQRFSQKEWQDLWRDEAGLDGMMPEEPHEKEQLMQLLDQVEQATDEPLSQQDKDRIFQRTWKWSAPQEREPVSWFGWFSPLKLKPVYMFVLGVGFGIWMTVQFQQGNLDIATDVQADDQLVVENSIYKKTMKGQVVQEEFPAIENPVIVVTKSPNGQREVNRAVHGTLDNKEIVFVWNLD